MTFIFIKFFNSYLIEVIYKNYWKDIIFNGLENNQTIEAYLIYFKANARGYATHDEILVLKNEINKKKLRFCTSVFGINDFYCNVIKKALYNPNNINEVVLYDFQMLRDAREKSDFDSIALQKVIFENDDMTLKWIE